MRDFCGRNYLARLYRRHSCIDPEDKDRGPTGYCRCYCCLLLPETLLGRRRRLGRSLSLVGSVGRTLYEISYIVNVCLTTNTRMSIGSRLREERKRLGLTQESLGQIGGVRKQAQLLYEKDSFVPDANYLAAIAATGVDVLYVLTGKRST